ncbi:MAG: hypothetical protein J0L97_04880 [Alphaproteobacteria bacterium]|nr:hypothetical protein [Alphaproteobacteria bacterium]
MQCSVWIPYDLDGFFAAENPAQAFLALPVNRVQTGAVFEHLTQREVNDIMRQAFGRLAASQSSSVEVMQSYVRDAYEQRGVELGIPRSPDSARDLARLIQTFTPVLERVSASGNEHIALGLSLAFDLSSREPQPALVHSGGTYRYTNGRNLLQDSAFFAHAMLEGASRAAQQLQRETEEHIIGEGVVYVTLPPLRERQTAVSAMRIVLAPAEYASVAVTDAVPSFLENGDINPSGMTPLVTARESPSPDAVLTLLLEREYGFVFASGGLVDIDVVLPPEYRSIKRGMSLEASGEGRIGLYYCQWHAAEDGLILQFRGVEPHIFLAAAAEALWDKFTLVNHVPVIEDIQQQMARQHGM